MTDTHEPTEMYRRFERDDGSQNLELDLDDTLVWRREGGSSWMCEEYDWDGAAEDAFDEAVESALSEGWVEDKSAATSLRQALGQAFGELPRAYATFLEMGHNVSDGGFHIRGVPTFSDDAVLLVDLATPGIVHMDFCGQNSQGYYIPISTELRDADNPLGDPHRVFFAVDRRDPRAPVVMVSAGAITPAFESIEALAGRIEAL